MLTDEIEYAIVKKREKILGLFFMPGIFIIQSQDDKEPRKHVEVAKCVHKSF